MTLSNGETVEMRLAERGVFLRHSKIWVREIRRLTQSGHQTPIVTTDYTTQHTHLAAAMFGRWGQENFFRYMLEHYGLDSLSTHCTEEIPDTELVVNPAHRDLESAIRKKNGVLSRLRSQFGGLVLNEPLEPKVVDRWEKQKAGLMEEIAAFESDLSELKIERKACPRHITCGELPSDQRFKQLQSSSKHFVDTIKMIAYRAETAMVQILRDAGCRHDEARSLLRAIFSNEADIIPDYEAGTLTVRLHHLANHMSAKAIHYLCQELNATETEFPETNLRLFYEMGSSQNP